MKENLAERVRATDAPNRIVHLHRAGTSVVLDVAAPHGPAIVHWGEELVGSTPESLSALAVSLRAQQVGAELDTIPQLSVMSTPAGSWLATPGLEGHRDGTSFSALFDVTDVQASDHHATLELVDAETHIAVTLDLRLGAGGVFHQRATLTNTGSSRYTVQSLLLTFPVPWDATEILDTTGHHLRERSPQRHEFTMGTHVRESRRGRPGSDATVLLAAGRPGFGFENGLVHGIHVGWSGNHRMLAERVITGEAFLAGGELFQPGEVILGPEETVQSPWVSGSWGDGLNALSHRFHDDLRARAHHPTRPRPVTLNTWEAVYFDHSFEKLASLADIAAGIGVERFVLDDGWFQGRRDDTAGLGDWFVDTEVWPRGLHPLVDRVRDSGMEFGLWVEPEMVNTDSDVARQHPDWILRARTSLPPNARGQQVLNLAHPDAYAFVSERLHSLLSEYAIAYLKWDHNRDLVDAGSRAGGVSLVRAQTQALYRLLGELREAHPGLEIESCASGGARVDLGILAHTDRIWTSDSLDPLERLDNQKYTGIVVPPELMGMHLTSPVVHSSRRTVSLEFSAAVALFGHCGIEWDLTAVDSMTLSDILDWVTLAKRLRRTVATGRMMHADGFDRSIDVRGVVGHNSESAFFTITQTATSVANTPGRVCLPGLDPARLYRLHVISQGDVHFAGQSALEWAASATILTGKELAVAGIRPPIQRPQSSTVIELVAV